jgi:AcrR family transcriptional regulator
VSDETRKPYRKSRRAELEAQTRERITEAAVRLHGTVGPARTTISAIAKDAGVQRATVYRHFPTQEDLFAACSAHFWAQHPPPDPAAWAMIEDPDARLAVALRELYRLYRDTAPMLERTSRDAPHVPAMAPRTQAFRGLLASMAETLMKGRPARGARRRRVAAAVGHAISFATWRSLTVDHGLDDEDAARLMSALVAGATEV